MRAIKNSFLFVILFSTFGISAYAYDEEWGIFQFRKRLDNGHQVFGEYVRRDRGNLLSAKFFDLYRLSWGGKLRDWTYLVGGAYVDFKTGSSERRLHQFGIYNFLAENKISGFFRLGLEERNFASDHLIYFRSRNRLHLNFLPQYAFGLSAYDELFYVLNGHDRFLTGFNENRFGLGFRYFLENLEIYVFHTNGYLKKTKTTDQVEWIQLQTVFSF